MCAFGGTELQRQKRLRGDKKDRQTRQQLLTAVNAFGDAPTLTDVFKKSAFGAGSQRLRRCGSTPSAVRDRSELRVGQRRKPLALLEHGHDEVIWQKSNSIFERRALVASAFGSRAFGPRDFKRAVFGATPSAKAPSEQDLSKEWNDKQKGEARVQSAQTPSAVDAFGDAELVVTGRASGASLSQPKSPTALDILAGSSEAAAAADDADLRQPGSYVELVRRRTRTKVRTSKLLARLDGNIKDMREKNECLLGHIALTQKVHKAIGKPPVGPTSYFGSNPSPSHYIDKDDGRLAYH
ncbi:hypothetical protein AXG93_267s1090 [Marchantia polymorpha subsp. ruderalis]|uniref:Uncharacterized protein n=1 Tax=Marchantia polymorpha subsp. ruderalis TaxID=1480154 RepID=A0A176VJ65_MARPO|nr:hypothetical protein AXG93_267s1090 [Marchantia polymorpha subsp. ruderalis]